MSLNAVDVIIGWQPPITKGTPTLIAKRMYVLIKDDVSEDSLKVILTDLDTVFEGKLLRCFVQPENPGDTVAGMLREKISADGVDTIFQLVPKDNTAVGNRAAAAIAIAQSSVDVDQDTYDQVLQIKTKLDKGGVRIADFALRKFDSIDSTSNESMKRTMAEVLGKAVEERKELEKHLMEMDARLTKQLEQNQLYCEQLLSKAADKEHANLELMKRFLPILNSKKQRIRELMDRVRELESGEDANDERIVRSDDEEDDEEQAKSDDETTKKAKPKAKLLASQKQNIPAVAKRVAATKKEDSQSKNSKSAPQTKIPAPEPVLPGETNESKRVTRGALKRDASLRASQEESIPAASSNKRARRSGGESAAQSSKPSQETNASKPTSGPGPIAEDEEGPLPPGWEIVTSKSKPGTKCYQNLQLKLRTFSRPKAPEPAPQAADVDSAPEATNKDKIQEEEEDDDPMVKAIKEYL